MSTARDEIGQELGTWNLELGTWNFELGTLFVVVHDAKSTLLDMLLFPHKI